MISPRILPAWLSSVLVGSCAGGGAPPAHVEPPSRVENAVAEGDLPLVHLTAEAMARVGLERATVTEGASPRTRLVGGEVVVPPGHALTVAAAVAGLVRGSLAHVAPGTAVHDGDVLFRLVPLAPVDRDVRARATREVAAARATLEATEARVRRQEALAAERAGSARALEEAVVARDVAAADLEMAEAREDTLRRAPLLSDVSMTVRAPADGIVRALSVAEGQAVVAGAALLELVAVDALEVRVPVYAGDLAALDASRPATIHRLGVAEGAAALEALATTGPPTAEPDRITVDRYFVAPATAGLAPGERVLVSLPLAGETFGRALPYAAMVLDSSGGAWVYECAGEGTFRRVRIDPVRRAGDLLVFERGPAVGTCVVSVGAAEVFGSEFEPGH